MAAVTPEPLLDDHARATIAEAITQAERGTSGEIYCVLARASGDYREAPLAWAAGAALLLPLAAVLLGWTPQWPTGWIAQAERPSVADAVTAYASVQAAVFALTAVLAAVPALRLRLTPGSLKREKVRRAALEQFLSHGLHRTSGRTGVLIYASQAEHRVEVIADEAIYGLVDAGVWGDIVADLGAALKRGDRTAGFVEAIQHCGEVLAERFPRALDDVNELPDHIVEL